MGHNLRKSLCIGNYDFSENAKISSQTDDTQHNSIQRLSALLAPHPTAILRRLVMRLAPNDRDAAPGRANPDDNASHISGMIHWRYNSITQVNFFIAKV